MLKNLFVLVALLSFSPLAGADSLDPCTPTVSAMPSRMSCVVGPKYYSVVINTLMSRPIKACEGKKHVEISSAKITISNQSGKKLGTLELPFGSFEYRLGLPGMDEAGLDSEEFDLHLDKCVTPAHGGMSAHN